jgi:SAM-dependent methyltransferase
LTHHDAFERLDIDKPDVDPVQTELHLARYQFASRWSAGKRVLDIACGTGYGAAMLARDAALVVGADIDASTIERARRRYDLSALSFVVGDAESPPVSGPFDLIASFETIEHLQRPEKFLESTCKLLAPGGMLIVSSPCRHGGSLDDPPQNRFHVREWNEAEFTEFLRNYFDCVTLHGQLIEFAKSWLPLNRSLATLLTKLRNPAQLGALHSRDVKPLKNLPPFRLRMAYLVAVCSHCKTR